MKQARVLIFFFMLISPTLQGQNGHARSAGGDILMSLQEDKDSEQVSIQVDSLLVTNYYKFMVMNKKDSGIPGFRIRIYSQSGLGAKEEQQRVKARFLSFYPGIDAYPRYDEPFFKLYVGDCRTRSEAQKMYNDIKKNFPNPIIVTDYINIKSSD